jgi:hypothetical protein
MKDGGSREDFEERRTKEMRNFARLLNQGVG